MNKFGGKFTLIGVITTVLGFLAFWPPETRLKTGIDLSGGTILVYEVKKESTLGQLRPRRADHRR